MKMRPCEIPISPSVLNFGTAEADEINVLAHSANAARSVAMQNELCPNERELVADALYKLSLAAKAVAA